jgi:hypothetical protein
MFGLLSGIPDGFSSARRASTAGGTLSHPQVSSLAKIASVATRRLQRL